MQRSGPRASGSSPARGAKAASAAARAEAVPVATPADLWRLGILAALGAWTIVVPYLGHAINLSVNVPARKEVVDHVLPGATILLVAGYLAICAYRGVKPAFTQMAGGGVCFLAGFWVAATHFSLVVDAVHGRQAWGPALWHASTSVPLVGLSLWTVLKDR